MDREALLAAIDLMRKFESGEVDAVSLRVFMADGTWQDIALGEKAADRAAVMKQLRAKSANAH